MCTMMAGSAAVVRTTFPTGEIVFHHSPDFTSIVGFGACYVYDDGGVNGSWLINNSYGRYILH